MHLITRECRCGYMYITQNRFHVKTFCRDKESYYIPTKWSFQQTAIPIINIYASNIWKPKYIEQQLTDLKGEFDSNTTLAGDFNKG